jgi:hypothetical protein
VEKKHREYIQTKRIKHIEKRESKKMIDYIELALYSKRVVVGGVEMLSDEDGNLYSLESIEEKLRNMIPGANLTKRITPRKSVIRPTTETNTRMLIYSNPIHTPELQPGTFLRPVLGNPYVETAE